MRSAGRGVFTHLPWIGRVSASRNRSWPIYGTGLAFRSAISSAASSISTGPPRTMNEARRTGPPMKTKIADYAVFICAPIIMAGCTPPSSTALETPTCVYQFTLPSPDRQARIDAFCGRDPQDLARCERFFLQHPNSEPDAEGAAVGSAQRVKSVQHNREIS